MSESMPWTCTFPRALCLKQNLVLLSWTIFVRLQAKEMFAETFSGVSAGKFTIGLGQDRLAFVNDREDVYSMALTGTDCSDCSFLLFSINECFAVVHNLMEKYEISYNDIGRLEVGTETIMDHSKYNHLSIVPCHSSWLFSQVCEVYSDATLWGKWKH